MPTVNNRSVQIGDVWRNGRQLRAGAASRFLLVADLDACWVSARRPDWRCMTDWTPAWRPDWRCMVEWTPLTGRGGVQIGNLGRIGRQLRAGAASRFGLYGGLDACWGLWWRPDLGYMADWTPLTGWGGVQIGDVWWNGRHLRVGAASRFGLLS